MKLAVDFAMLERQIDLGDEERRAVYRLSDMLDTMNSAGLITDPSSQVCFSGWKLPSSAFPLPIYACALLTEVSLMV